MVRTLTLGLAVLVAGAVQVSCAGTTPSIAQNTVASQKKPFDKVDLDLNIWRSPKSAPGAAGAIGESSVVQVLRREAKTADIIFLTKDPLKGDAQKNGVRTVSLSELSPLPRPKFPTHQPFELVALKGKSSPETLGFARVLFESPVDEIGLYLASPGQSANALFGDSRAMRPSLFRLARDGDFESLELTAQGWIPGMRVYVVDSASDKGKKANSTGTDVRILALTQTRAFVVKADSKTIDSEVSDLLAQADHSGKFFWVNLNQVFLFAPGPLPRVPRAD